LILFQRALLSSSAILSKSKIEEKEKRRKNGFQEASSKKLEIKIVDKNLGKNYIYFALVAR